jgi:hypothetical protein
MEGLAAPWIGIAKTRSWSLSQISSSTTKSQLILLLPLPAPHHSRRHRKTDGGEASPTLYIDVHFDISHWTTFSVYNAQAMTFPMIPEESA